MPTSPDYPQFVPDGETIGTVLLEEMHPGITYDLEQQPSRNRELTLDPGDLSLVAVQFLRDPGKRRQVLDLRDVVLVPIENEKDTEGARVKAKQIVVDLLEGRGFAVDHDLERYRGRPEESPTREEKFQDEKLPAVGNPFDVLIKDRNKLKPRR